MRQVLSGHMLGLDTLLSTKYVHIATSTAEPEDWAASEMRLPKNDARKVYCFRSMTYGVDERLAHNFVHKKCAQGRLLRPAEAGFLALNAWIGALVSFEHGFSAICQHLHLSEAVPSDPL